MMRGDPRDMRGDPRDIRDPRDPRDFGPHMGPRSAMDYGHPRDRDHHLGGGPPSRFSGPSDYDYPPHHFPGDRYGPPPGSYRSNGPPPSLHPPSMSRGYSTSAIDDRGDWGGRDYYHHGGHHHPDYYDMPPGGGYGGPSGPPGGYHRDHYPPYDSVKKPSSVEYDVPPSSGPRGVDGGHARGGSSERYGGGGRPPFIKQNSNSSANGVSGGGPPGPSIAGPPGPIKRSISAPSEVAPPVKQMRMEPGVQTEKDKLQSPGPAPSVVKEEPDVPKEKSVKLEFTESTSAKVSTVKDGASTPKVVPSTIPAAVGLSDIKKKIEMPSLPSTASLSSIVSSSSIASRPPTITLPSRPIIPSLPPSSKLVGVAGVDDDFLDDSMDLERDPVPSLTAVSGTILTGDKSATGTLPSTTPTTTRQPRATWGKGLVRQVPTTPAPVSNPASTAATPSTAVDGSGTPMVSNAGASTPTVPTTVAPTESKDKAKKDELATATVTAPSIAPSIKIPDATSSIESAATVNTPVSKASATPKGARSPKPTTSAVVSAVKEEPKKEEKEKDKKGKPSKSAVSTPATATDEEPPKISATIGKSSSAANLAEAASEVDTTKSKTPVPNTASKKKSTKNEEAATLLAPSIAQADASPAVGSKRDASMAPKAAEVAATEDVDEAKRKKMKNSSGGSTPGPLAGKKEKESSEEITTAAEVAVKEEPKVEPVAVVKEEPAPTSPMKRATVSTVDVNQLADEAAASSAKPPLAPKTAETTSQKKPKKGKAVTIEDGETITGASAASLKQLASPVGAPTTGKKKDKDGGANLSGALNAAASAAAIALTAKERKAIKERSYLGNIFSRQSDMHKAYNAIIYMVELQKGNVDQTNMKAIQSLNTLSAQLQEIKNADSAGKLIMPRTNEICYVLDLLENTADVYFNFLKSSREKQYMVEVSLKEALESFKIQDEAKEKEKAAKEKEAKEKEASEKENEESTGATSDLAASTISEPVPVVEEPQESAMTKVAAKLLSRTKGTAPYHDEQFAKKLQEIQHHNRLRIVEAHLYNTMINQGHPMREMDLTAALPYISTSSTSGVVLASSANPMGAATTPSAASTALKKNTTASTSSSSLSNMKDIKASTAPVAKTPPEEGSRSRTQSPMPGSSNSGPHASIPSVSETVDEYVNGSTATMVFSSIGNPAVISTPEGADATIDSLNATSTGSQQPYLMASFKQTQGIMQKNRPIVAREIYMRKLHRRRAWEELADRYLKQSHKWNVHISDVEREEERLALKEGPRLRGASSTASGMRAGNELLGGLGANRPPLHSISASAGLSAGGMAGVGIVRSEYEQDRLLNELYSKEARAKRIEQGLCEIPSMRHPWPYADTDKPPTPPVWPRELRVFDDDPDPVPEVKVKEEAKEETTTTGSSVATTTTITSVTSKSTKAKRLSGFQPQAIVAPVVPAPGSFPVFKPDYHDVVDTSSLRLTIDGKRQLCHNLDIRQPCPLNCNCALQVERLQSFDRLWTDMEKAIFVDKFLQYPKNFHRIASFLPNRTTKDCVKFYYDAKNTIEFKHLLKEFDYRRRTSGNNQRSSQWHYTVKAAHMVNGAVYPPADVRDPNKDFLIELPSGDMTYNTFTMQPPANPTAAQVNHSLATITSTGAVAWSTVIHNNHNNPRCLNLPIPLVYHKKSLEPEEYASQQQHQQAVALAATAAAAALGVSTAANVPIPPDSIPPPPPSSSGKNTITQLYPHKNTIALSYRRRFEDLLVRYQEIETERQERREKRERSYYRALNQWQRDHNSFLQGALAGSGIVPLNSVDEGTVNPEDGDTSPITPGSGPGVTLTAAELANLIGTRPVLELSDSEGECNPVLEKELEIVLDDYNRFTKRYAAIEARGLPVPEKKLKKKVKFEGKSAESNIVVEEEKVVLVEGENSETKMEQQAEEQKVENEEVDEEDDESSDDDYDDKLIEHTHLLKKPFQHRYTYSFPNKKFDPQLAAYYVYRGNAVNGKVNNQGNPSVEASRAFFPPNYLNDETAAAAANGLGGHGHGDDGNGGNGRDANGKGKSSRGSYKKKKSENADAAAVTAAIAAAAAAGLALPEGVDPATIAAVMKGKADAKAAGLTSPTGTAAGKSNKPRKSGSSSTAEGETTGTPAVTVPATATAAVPTTGAVSSAAAAALLTAAAAAVAAKAARPRAPTTKKPATVVIPLGISPALLATKNQAKKVEDAKKEKEAKEKESGNISSASSSVSESTKDAKEADKTKAPDSTKMEKTINEPAPSTTPTPTTPTPAECGE